MVFIIVLWWYLLLSIDPNELPKLELDSRQGIEKSMISVKRQ